jgi:hypothetical protein
VHLYKQADIDPRTWVKDSHDQKEISSSIEISLHTMASPSDIERFGQFALGFNKDTNIDRHKCRRTTPLEVLHLAHSRTGTLSTY